MMLSKSRTPLILLLLSCRLFHPLLPLLVHKGTIFFVESAATDGRHSYSLTTFDPDGNLGQVERAMIAASLGTPIVGAVKRNNIILASPQVLPSSLMKDDGTSRFAVISPQIVLGHSGIASDGRVVIKSAQRLAIEHSYTYDEPIPITVFLEELSLLFQAYTMKPGARPFGCTLLIGYLPPHSFSESTRKCKSDSKPQLFKMDCSGYVEELGTVAIINANFEGSDLRKDLLDFASKIDDDNITMRSRDNAMEDREFISRMVKEALKQKSKRRKAISGTTKSLSKDNTDMIASTESIINLPLRIVSASFGVDETFEVERLLTAEM